MCVPDFFSKAADLKDVLYLMQDAREKTSDFDLPCIFVFNAPLVSSPSWCVSVGVILKMSTSTLKDNLGMGLIPRNC